MSAECPARVACAEEAAAPSMAVRAGWAYGLGGEFEYRPGHWGLGAAGGFVPGYGPGGYAGVLWGARRLGTSGLVAEGGSFYGQRNPLRTAASGLGAHLLGGCEWALTPRASIRAVAGGGLPFTGALSWHSLEFLARLTVGLTF